MDRESNEEKSSDQESVISLQLNNIDRDGRGAHASVDLVGEAAASSLRHRPRI